MASMSCPAQRDIDHAYSTSVAERIRRLQRVKGAKKVLEMNSGQLTEALHSKDYSKLAAEELAKAVVRHNKTHPAAKAPKPRMGQLRGIKCFGNYKIRLPKSSGKQEIGQVRLEDTRSCEIR